MVGSVCWPFTSHSPLHRVVSLPPYHPPAPRDTTREENGMSVTRSEPKWATSEASGSITFQPYRPSSFPLLIPFPSRPVRGAEGRSPGRTTMGRERERWATCHYGRMSVSCLCLSSNRSLCSLRSWACHSPPFTSVPPDRLRRVNGVNDMRRKRAEITWGEPNRRTAGTRLFSPLSSSLLLIPLNPLRGTRWV